MLETDLSVVPVALLFYNYLIEYYKYTRHIQFMAMSADEEEMSLISPYRARDSAWLYSLKKTLALVSNLRSGPLSSRAAILHFLWNVVDNMAGERLLGGVIKSNSLANMVINNILVEGTTGGKIRYNLLYYWLLFPCSWPCYSQDILSASKQSESCTIWSYRSMHEQHQPPFWAGMPLMETHVCSLPMLKLRISPEHFTVNSINNSQNSNILGSSFGRHRLPFQEWILMSSLNPQEEDFEGWYTAWSSLTNEFWSGRLRSVSGCAFEKLPGNWSYMGRLGSLLLSLPFCKHYFQGFPVS